MSQLKLRFPKERRILTSAQFSEVLKKGRFAADDVLVVNARVASVAFPKSGVTGRLGVTIPKKTGTAVVRNRWKRLIREAYRLDQHQFPVGFDFVVKPKRGARPDFSSIRRSLRRLAARATKTHHAKRSGN